MDRSTTFEIMGFILIIIGLGIFFYLYPPNFEQVLVVAAILLIIVGIFVGIGGVVASVSRASAGTPIK